MEVRYTTTVRRIRNGKEITIKLEASTGDVWQDYTGSGASPDFTVAANQPVIWAEVYSNKNRIIYTDPKWRYNATDLTFNATTGLSTNTGLEGVFKQETYQGVPALRICKNLASANNQDNDMIYLDCAYKVGGIDDRAQAALEVQIGRKSADVYKGVIAPVDGKGFTIREAGGSVKAYAKLWHGSVQVDNASYTVKWKKNNGTDITDLTAENGQAVVDTADHTITITAGMVNSAMNLYAYFYAKDNPTNLLTTDVQGIVDASDPLHINPGATPASETIINDNNVVYKPYVMGDDGQRRTEFDGKFKFFPSNEKGETITTKEDHTVNATTTHTVYPEDFDKNNTDAINMEIVSDDSFTAGK